MRYLFFISIVFLIHVPRTTCSQSLISINSSCSYFGEEVPASVYGFSSDVEATNLLRRIVDASGLEMNFKLLAGDVPNAVATIIGDDRYIIYNQTFMHNVQKDINNWASISILAHEIGHHLNGHSLKPGGSRPNIELEADKFSGFILAKMGASLNQAQAAINALASDIGSSTHPGKNARLAAIANGWYKAKESTNISIDGTNLPKTATKNIEAKPSASNITPSNSVKKSGQFSISSKSANSNLQLGDKAIDLIFSTNDGLNFSLSSLKGKMVLLDFWASWCGPCRKESPNLVSAYNRFKNTRFSNGANGFTIFNVSLDKDLGAWNNAIINDGLIWPNHASDLGGWQSFPALIYKVNSIPANYLIDHRGIIVGKNLRGADLEDALENLK